MSRDEWDYGSGSRIHFQFLSLESESFAEANDSSNIVMQKVDFLLLRSLKIRSLIVLIPPKEIRHLKVKRRGLRRQ